jgi:hypothetical protein
MCYNEGIVKFRQVSIMWVGGQVKRRHAIQRGSSFWDVKPFVQEKVEGYLRM